MKVKTIIGPVIHATKSGNLVIHEHVRIDIKKGKVKFQL